MDQNNSNGEKPRDNFFNKNALNHKSAGPAKTNIWQNRVFKYLIISIGIIGLLWFFYWVGTKDENNLNKSDQTAQTPSANSTSSISNQPSPTTAPAQTNSPTAQNINAINDVATQMVAKSSGYCKALAPTDWTIVADGNGRGVDLANTNQTQGAGWFIAPVISALYGEPDTAIPTVMQQIGNPNYTFTDSGKTIDGGFTMRNFTATIAGKSVKGTAIYKKYPVDDSGYVLSYYHGIAESNIWDQVGATPMSVAISIRCTAQYTPSTSDGFSSSGSSSVSDTSDKLDMSEKWQEAIMGYENVYSPSTGDHYEAPLNTYNETGPDGAGYYRSTGTNSYEKLERGFGDY